MSGHKSSLKITVKGKSKHSILVTLGLRALYTHIPNNKGIEAMKETIKGTVMHTKFFKSILIFIEIKVFSFSS